MKPRSVEFGFTLMEMIVVIVITGIIAGIVAVFLKAPVDQYMDISRRAGMTDVADTALRRITRELRLALPNSIRVAGNCTGNPSNTCFIEFLPTGSASCAVNALCLGGGRYRAGVGAGGNDLDFTNPTDATFDVLGTMPTMSAGTDEIVISNLGINGANAYEGNSTAAHNRRKIKNISGSVVEFEPAIAFPFESPGSRFHVISTPVTYVCAPAVNGVGGTLTRYWGYSISSTQPTTVPIPGSSSALLATNVSFCRFSYDANVIAQRNALVTVHLGISEGGESIMLYNVAHVSNQP